MFLPESKEIIKPKGGWKQGGIYLVEVSWHSGNPVHEAILFVGFLEDGNFAGYCEIYSNSYDHPMKCDDVYYLKPIKLLHVRR
jgi:hypothetical protein